MIRIGVDAWNLPGDRRGIGRYLRSILRAWGERDANRVEVTLVVPEWDTWRVRGRYRRSTEQPYRVVSRRFHRRAHLDALWFPFNGCSWLDFSLPAVATLHDASNFVVPGHAPEAQHILRDTAERCAALVTVSRFSQGELARELAIPRERIEPILLGVGTPLPVQRDAFVASLEPFVLFVGTMEPHKGFDLLAHAMVCVQQQHPELTLVAAGDPHRKKIPHEGARIRALGYVDDARLAALYRACSLFVFPSRYEGFGLPVLEAMSYGAPVVVPRSTSLPEAGGDAAYYVEPGDADALAQAILDLVGDRAYVEDLRRRGFARAAAMPWERTAAATLNVFERVLR